MSTLRRVRRRGRTALTLLVMAGLLATAAGVQATAASWTDSAEFTAAVSAATTTSTTTTTSSTSTSTSTTTTTSTSTTTTVAPLPDPLVRVTSICKGPTTYTLRVRNESAVTLDFDLRVGNNIVSGPHTIEGGWTEQFYEIPNDTNGVKAIPVGDWTNSSQGTASTPTTPCTPPTTTTTSTTTTTTTTSSSTTSTTSTTAPPPPSPSSVSSGGISAANADTVIRSIDWNITRARQVCTVANITGIDATPRAWAIRVDLNAAPWYRTAPHQIDLNGTGIVTVESPSSVLIKGRTHGGRFDPRTNNTPLTSDLTATITICNYNAPVPPPADPSWFTVSTTQGTWTDTTACVVVTIATTRSDFATNPFFYGWATTVDLTAAKARITGAGKTLNFVSWSPYPNGSTDFWASPESYQPPLDSYTLTSGFNAALRASGSGNESTTATVCVNGY